MCRSQTVIFGLPKSGIAENKNNRVILVINTARKSTFSFSRLTENMTFPNKSRWNMTFPVLSRKMIFLFLENMISPLRRKMKDDLSQKKYTEI